MWWISTSSTIIPSYSASTILGHLFISTKKVGENVLVFDFGGDWPGMEAAIYLAEKGTK